MHPKTDYIFFVADPGLTGSSSFSSTLAEHNKLAKAYQEWLSGYLRKKAEQDKAKKRLHSQRNQTMTRFERIVISLPPIAWLLRQSKRVFIPGFDGVPLYDVLIFFCTAGKKNRFQ